MEQPIVSIDNVSVSYEDKIALENVSIDINPHDFIGVIGPNGGGKTTLIKVILGIISPSKGEVRYNSNSFKRRHFGYLPQVSNVDGEFPISLGEIVLSGLQYTKGLWKGYTKADKLSTEALMEESGIITHRDKRACEVSGGELQRALLCRAIISQPKLLVLDEPTTYVDDKFGKELSQWLKELNKDMAIVMVSHDLGMVSNYVKSIACVNRSLHFHNNNIITSQQYAMYDCPIQLIAHGDIPHTVLKRH